MQADESSARKLWKAALGPTPACPDIERIGLFSEGRLPEQEAAQVSAHLAGCAHCRSELKMLHEFQSGMTRNEERSEVEWISAELHRRSGEVHPRAAQRKVSQDARTGWWKSFFSQSTFSRAAFAAACLLVLGSAAVFVRERRRPALAPDVNSGGTVFRSQEVTTLGPSGDLDEAPNQLSWNVFPGATAYSVRIMEVDHTVLWQTRTTGTQIELPREVRDRAVPGKPLIWSVDALNSAERVVASSAPQRFRVILGR